MSDVEHETPVSAGDTPSFQRVGSLSALRSGGNFAVTVAGRRVAVFRVDDAVVATQGRCPHAKGPIHEGDVTAGTLTCPWHGYTFSLSTGACDDDPDLILERYEVHIDGDDILVRL
jgi:nitrite reductase/ring-hydroxylating ferredoxin subunit